MHKSNVFHTLQIGENVIKGYVSPDGPSIMMDNAKAGHSGQVGIGPAIVRHFTPADPLSPRNNVEGWWIVKYHDEHRFLLEGVSESDAMRIATVFGLDFRGKEQKSFRHPAFNGLYTAEAWVGLVNWVAAHPRIAARYADCENYMPGWYEKAKAEGRANTRRAA